MPVGSPSSSSTTTGSTTPSRASRASASVEVGEGGLEIIIVDNGSPGGDAARIRDAVPDAHVVALKQNVGFAGGCNRGRRSRHRRVPRLPEQRRASRPALARGRARRAARTTARSRASPARCSTGTARPSTSSMPRSRSTATASSSTSASRPSAMENTASDVLFASGAAMVMPTPTCSVASAASTSATSCSSRTSTSAGGSGCSATGCATCPDRSCTTATTRRWRGFGAWREHYLLERNALFTIFKNYDDDNLRPVLPAALLLAIRRGITLGGDDAHALDLAQDANAQAGKLLTVDKQTVAPAYAIDAFVDALAGLERVAPGAAGGAASPRPRDHAAVPAPAAAQHRGRPLPRGVQGRGSTCSIPPHVHRVAAGSSSPPATCCSRRWPVRRSAPGRSRACSSREHEVQLASPHRVHARAPRLPASCRPTTAASPSSRSGPTSSSSRAT